MLQFKLRELEEHRVTYTGRRLDVALIRHYAMELLYVAINLWNMLRWLPDERSRSIVLMPETLLRASLLRCACVCGLDRTMYMMRSCVMSMACV